MTLTAEKPVAGGRMLARHEGQIVLVAGAIPGERVRARVERVSRQLRVCRDGQVLDRSPGSPRRGRRLGLRRLALPTSTIHVSCR